MYAALTPATIQDETGSLRQLYVTLEQTQETAGLSLGDLTDSQPGALSSQLVTVALPSNQGGVQQLSLTILNDDMALVLQPQPGNLNATTLGAGTAIQPTVLPHIEPGQEIESTTTQTSQGPVHRLIMTNPNQLSGLVPHLSQVALAMKQAGIPMVATPQGLGATTDVQTELPAQQNSSTLDIQQTNVDLTNHVDDINAQQELQLQQQKAQQQQQQIQQELQQQQQKIQQQQQQIQQQQKQQTLSALQNLLLGGSLTPSIPIKSVPAPTSATSPRHSNKQTSQPPVTAPAVSTSKQVFSTVKATLSEALLAAIPGSKAVYLSKLQQDCNVQLEHDKASNTYTVNGDHVDMLLDVHNRLSRLMGTTPSHLSLINAQTSTDDIQLHIQEIIPRSDKAILCDLLKPQFSRSGREVKRKVLDLPDDYTIIEPDKRRYSNKPSQSRLFKKKPGRPPKRKQYVDLTVQDQNGAVTHPANISAKSTADTSSNEDVYPNKMSEPTTVKTIKTEQHNGNINCEEQEPTKKTDIIQQAMGEVFKSLIQDSEEVGGEELAEVKNDIGDMTDVTMDEKDSVVADDEDAGEKDDTQNG